MKRGSQPLKPAIESHLRFAEYFRVHVPISTSEFAAVSTPPPRNNSLRCTQGSLKVLRVASGWPRGGRPPWSFFASVDTQPARGNRGLRGIDPDFRLPTDQHLRPFPAKSSILLGLI